MIEQDRTEALRSALGEARDRQAALCIVGGESKRFYGRTPAGEPFSVRGHCGIIDYQPTELVVTARAGTPMSLLQQVLAEQGQTLACESPQYSDRATVGGTVATNASGPGRPFLGSVRDFVLGLRLLTGQGQVLSFGGQVIKNVAGYDLSRLSCGALGTLGVILEVSFKVLPLAETEQTLRLPMDAEAAIAFMNRTAGSPYPVTAMCFDGEAVHYLAGRQTAWHVVR